MQLFRKAGRFDVNDSASIVNACREGNRNAQHALVEHYFNYVKTIALRYAASDEIADEIANDSFLKVFQNLEKYDLKQPLKNWIRKITINTAIDEYRKNSKIPETELVENQTSVEIPDEVLSQLSASEILKMVQKLTPAYRMVFSMYVIDGFTHKEIAERLGIHEGTSKSNLLDARRKLREMILKYNPDLYRAYEIKNVPRHER